MTTQVPPFSVLIVEPDEYRRQRHQLELTRESDFTIVSAVGGKREAIAYLARNAVDFIVTNSMLPDGNPADVIRSAQRRNPNCLILAVSGCEDAHIVMHTIVSGANGYVLFSDTNANLGSCLRVLQAGGSPVSPVVARTVLRSLQSRREQPAAGKPEHPLSARELDILRLLSKGLSYVQIGQILTLSKSTVSTHAKNIYRKLDAHSRSQAVYRAQELNIL